jgi:hypothetical protein
MIAVTARFWPQAHLVGGGVDVAVAKEEVDVVGLDVAEVQSMGKGMPKVTV